MKLKHYDLFDVTYLAIACICETIMPYLESLSNYVGCTRQRMDLSFSKTTLGSPTQRELSHNVKRQSFCKWHSSPGSGNSSTPGSFPTECDKLK